MSGGECQDVLAHGIEDRLNIARPLDMCTELK